MWPSRILCVWAFLTGAFAWRPTDDDCDGRLCLTSFIWCSREGHTDGDCYFPPDVYQYALSDYRGPPAVISWGKSYNLSWANHDPDYPVTIRWSFPNGIDPDASVPTQWELNLTSIPSPSYYIFEPTLDETWFPNVTNTTAAEAKAFAADATNIIQIVQYEAAQAASRDDELISPMQDAIRLGYYASSDQFIVEDGWAIAFAENSLERNNREWNHRLRLGLGIGLGLGIPFLIAITAVATWFCCARRNKRRTSHGKA